MGSVAYHLELPAESKIHPVFHISQLKSVTPDNTSVYSALPALTDLQAPEAQPDTILEHRLVKKGNHAVPQVLITWSGLPVSSATCKDYYVVKKHFPVAPAWGQAASSAGGDVTVHG